MARLTFSDRDLAALARGLTCAILAEDATLNAHVGGDALDRTIVRECRSAKRLFERMLVKVNAARGAS